MSRNAMKPKPKRVSKGEAIVVRAIESLQEAVAELVAEALECRKKYHSWNGGSPH
jgi:hypothetical protein